MHTLTAQQILILIFLDEDEDADDSCDDDEVDFVEAKLDSSESDDDSEEEIQLTPLQTPESCDTNFFSSQQQPLTPSQKSMNMLQTVIPLSQFQQTRSPSLKRINRRVNRLSKLAKLESEEIRSVEFDQSDANVILGRQNTKKTNIAFEWFEKPKVISKIIFAFIFL